MRRTSAGLFLLCAIGLTAVVCLQASGAVTFFTGEGARERWQSAIGGDVAIRQSFDAINFLSPDLAKDVAFPGFTIEQAPGFAFNFTGDRAIFSVSETNPLFLQYNFVGGAVGLDIGDLQGALNVQIFESGSRGSTSFVIDSNGFFGVVADPGRSIEAFNFTAIDVDDVSNEISQFSVDNLSLGQAVPEPSSFAILFTAMFSAGGFVGWQRWRRGERLGNQDLA